MFKNVYSTVSSNASHWHNTYNKQTSWHLIYFFYTKLTTPTPHNPSPLLTARRCHTLGRQMSLKKESDCFFRRAPVILMRTLRGAGHMVTWSHLQPYIIASFLAQPIFVNGPASSKKSRQLTDGGGEYWIVTGFGNFLNNWWGCNFRKISPVTKAN